MAKDKHNAVGASDTPKLGNTSCLDNCAAPGASQKVRGSHSVDIPAHPSPGGAQKAPKGAGSTTPHAAPGGAQGI